MLQQKRAPGGSFTTQTHSLACNGVEIRFEFDIALSFWIVRAGRLNEARLIASECGIDLNVERNVVAGGDCTMRTQKTVMTRQYQSAIGLRTTSRSQRRVCDDQRS